jgi:hypothetical protein
VELSAQEFLDSVQNPNTKKEYRHGIKKFCDWFELGHSACFRFHCGCAKPPQYGQNLKSLENSVPYCRQSCAARAYQSFARPIKNLNLTQLLKGDCEHTKICF